MTPLKTSHQEAPSGVAMADEQELAREFLHSVLGGMKAGLYSIDHAARITTFTPQAESLTGFDRNEILGRRCHEVFKTDHCEKCPVKGTDRAPSSPINFEGSLTTKSGGLLPVDVTISPLRSDRSEVFGAVGIFRDMTGQNRLWEKLRRERDRARKYLQVARVTIVALDARGRVTLINKAGCETLDYQEDEILGRDWFDLCVPERLRERARRVFDLVLAGETEHSSAQDTPIVTKNGGERFISWQYTPLEDEEGRVTGLLCSGEDVTDRRRAEAELIRSEKLAAIGQLAAGVAHEVNNPLAGLLVYFKLLQKKYREGTLQSEETLKQLQRMEHETERSSRIIKDLLDFSRQSKPALRPIDLNEVVGATLSIVGHQISLANIDLRTELTADLPRVVADFDQIQQALMNVTLNAIQAMPDGGSLTIATSLARGVEVAGALRDWIRIDIADTGKGIAAGDLEKVFTPFFSTKPKGGGVGLGLSAVQGIIERHKGRIEVHSELDVGTTFSIWLGIQDEGQAQGTRR